MIKIEWLDKIVEGWGLGLGRKALNQASQQNMVTSKRINYFKKVVAGAPDNSNWLNDLEFESVRPSFRPPMGSFVSFNNGDNMDSLTRTKIKSLDLSKRNISDEYLKDLIKEYPNLEEIKLGCQKITDVGIAVLATQCKEKLRSVNLEGCKQVTDAGVKALARYCPNLRSVNLEGCEKVTDKSVLALEIKCQNLEFIRLKGCENLTDRIVLFLAANCEALRVLTLPRENITDETCYLIASGFKRLEYLGLHHKVEENNSINAVVQECIKLKSFWLCGEKFNLKS